LSFGFIIIMVLEKYFKENNTKTKLFPRFPYNPTALLIQNDLF